MTTQTRCTMGHLSVLNAPVLYDILIFVTRQRVHSSVTFPRVTAGGLTGVTRTKDDEITLSQKTFVDAPDLCHAK